MDGSSSTYLMNKDNAASIPLQWNSRPRSDLLASIRTCHIALKSRKGLTSSMMRSYHKHQMKSSKNDLLLAHKEQQKHWKINLRKKNMNDQNHSYKRDKFRKLQPNLCQGSNAADCQYPIITWHQPDKCHLQVHAINDRYY